MTLRVVGAGIGRTGTNSLKIALEQLLGAPCYHMIEVFEHPDHIPMWQEAVDTGAAPWDELFSGYAAAVDWPVGSFYGELMAAYPDAIVLLSTRDSDSWWKSASSTIFNFTQFEAVLETDPWRRMVMGMMATRFTDRLDDEAVAKAAYERHNAEVRASVPSERLLQWEPDDGWEPICAALGVAVPDQPFPHTNTTAEFRARASLDASP
jgi:hypothetical protein